MVIEFLKRKKEDIRRKWILHRHGYKDWDMYLRMTDPDILWRASRVKDFYHGYPYYYRFERGHRAYNLLYDYGPGGHRYVVNDIQDWCEANIKGKYRFDAHRVMCAASTGYEWEFNELGGGDYYYAAFKDERDYLWFLMKWS